jgi:hypothetical protein
MAGEIACPSCGAPHDVSNPGVTMSVCEYCGNAVIVSETGLENLGKQATLDEGFTRLYRGAAGTVYGARFRVLGRARYSFGRGFWDEWFIEQDGAGNAWVTEDNHELAVQRPAEKATVPAFAELRPGAEIVVQGTKYYVHELGQAACIGVEGDLPRVISADDTFDYADASSMNGKYALGIEFKQAVRVFTGRWVGHDSLVLDDAGHDR